MMEARLYFERHYSVGPAAECWLWTGYIAFDGYGRFKFKRKSYQAHRLAWQYANPDTPLRGHICHYCNIKHCVNPAHLYEGNDLTNVYDREKLGIWGGQSKQPLYGKKWVTVMHEGRWKRIFLDD